MNKLKIDNNAGAGSKRKTCCLLCSSTTKLEKNTRQNNLKNKYRSSWTLSTCKLLNLDDSCHVFFEKSVYCSKCLQVILDVDFAIKTIKVLEARLRSSRIYIRRLLASNFKSDTNRIISKLLLEHSLSAVNKETSKNILESENKPKARIISLSKSPHSQRFQESKKNNSRTLNVSKEIFTKKPENEVLIKKETSPLPNYSVDYSNVEAEEISLVNSDDKVTVVLDDFKKESSPDDIDFDSVFETKSLIQSDIEIKKNTLRELKERTILRRMLDAEKAGKLELKIKRKLKKKPKHSSSSPPSKKVLKKPKSNFNDDIVKFKCNHTDCVERSDLVFKKIRHLKNHLIEEHNGECLNTPYHCLKCSLQFSKVSIFANHFARKHDTSLFKCSMCPKAFKQQYHLNLHCREIHTEIRMKPKCTMCTKILENEEEVVKHESAHKEMLDNFMPYACLLCDLKNITNKSDLQKHVKETHENSFIKCPQCGRICISKKSLKSHMRIHKETPYACTQCPKKYNVPSHLRSHLLTHSDPTFKCKIEGCGKMFHKPNILNRHMENVHSLKEKNFKCLLCPRAFVSMGLLKAHEVYHASDRPFLCEICSFACKSKRNLANHKSTHLKNETNFKLNRTRKARITQLPPTVNNQESSIVNLNEPQKPDQSYNFVSHVPDYILPTSTLSIIAPNVLPF